MPKKSRRRKKNPSPEPKYKPGLIQTHGPLIISPQDASLDAVHEYWEEFLSDHGIVSRWGIGDTVPEQRDFPQNFILDSNHLVIMDKYLYGQSWRDGMIHVDDLYHFIFGWSTSKFFLEAKQEHVLEEIQRLLIFPNSSLFYHAGYTLGCWI